jgi:hypothetical protein
MFRRKQLPNFRRNITFVARTVLHLTGTSRQIRNKQKSHKKSLTRKNQNEANP